MVAHAYIESLRSGSYLDRVREGLDFVGASGLIGPDTRVFVKPNLTFPSYVPGVMTSPEAVEAAIVALKDYTPHITIGDADSGGYNPFSMDKVYGEIGMYDLGKRHGVDIVNLSDLPRRPLVIDGSRPLTVPLPALLTEDTDLLVTMPVPKIHMNTGVSLTFKNQWGCIPDPLLRPKLHSRFSRVVLEVNRAVHAGMAIVDGRWGLDVNGPMRGEAVELQWLMVTDDIGAGARLCCELMQVPLEDIRHLRYAEGRGAIPARSDIKLNQELTPFLGPRFHLHRAWTDYPSLFAFRSRTVAYVAYYSPLSSALHKLLYRFREPFYDYEAERPDRY